MKVLSLDTTADDTSAAVVVDGKKILANVVFSQIKFHQKFGGIVPQIASREHLKAVLPAVDRALKKSRLNLGQIDLIAVGQSPDPALSYYHIGLTTAKVLAYVWQVPLVGVDHVEAHLFANLAVFPSLTFPFVSLTAAGGHTLLVLAKGFGQYQILGSTLDDAAGEAFDKVARVLGLTYPGGPAIDRVAVGGNPQAYPFPRPMIGQKNFNFSFSGLKTAVYLKVKELVSSRGDFRPDRRLTRREVKDLAASFRAAVSDSLLFKTFRAAREFKVSRVVLGGGVAANRQLRQGADDLGAKGKVRVFYPPPDLCTDNAVGTAVLGYYQFKKKGADDPFKISYYRKSPLENW